LSKAAVAILKLPLFDLAKLCRQKTECQNTFTENED